jgi:hypothetical protein
MWSVRTEHFVSFETIERTLCGGFDEARPLILRIWPEQRSAFCYSPYEITAPLTDAEKRYESKLMTRSPTLSHMRRRYFQFVPEFLISPE